MKRVILYIRFTNIVGGIETFIYNFCLFFHDKYDITVVVEEMADVQTDRLRKIVTVDVGKSLKTYECDTLIMCRVLDEVPKNIKYKKLIRRVHTCKAYGVNDVDRSADVTVCVSEVVKNDFKLDDAVVINNLIQNDSKPTLLLMSATRIPAPDKGDNEKRMLKLARMIEEADIPYIWLNFSDGKLDDAPKHFFNMGISLDIQSYMQKADYVVQLSSVEAYSNTILEALINQVPVICTPFPSAFEQGVMDGVNGYVVPFDMDFDVRRLLNIPKFNYTVDNEKRIEQWLQIL